MNGDFKDLIKRYKEGSVSSQEKRLVEAWYLSYGNKGDSIDKDELIKHYEDGRQELQLLYRRDKMNLYWRLSIAAAIILALFSAVYWNYFPVNINEKQIVDIESIEPGENKAFLKFSNQELSVSDIDYGVKVSQGCFEVERVNDEKIKLNSLEGPWDVKERLVIRTPKGGEIEVLLPDGTSVKMNADSELSFLSNFNSENRHLNLIGEAYFDVISSDKPFIVQSEKQQVTVLGTKFNIKAYPNEGNVTTKLITGSLKINDYNTGKEVFMKPGDQVVNQGEELTLSKKELQIVDWVDKEIVFNKKSIEEIMNDISRWYNIEVEFQDSLIKNKTFTGTISRYTKFNKVIEVLGRTESLNFKVKGRKVIVSN